MFPILNRFKARSPVDASGEARGTPPNVGCTPGCGRIPEDAREHPWHRGHHRHGLRGCDGLIARNTERKPWLVSTKFRGVHWIFPSMLEHPKKKPQMLEFPLCKKIMAHMCKRGTHQQAERLKKRGEICEKRTYEFGKKDEQLQNHKCRSMMSSLQKMEKETSQN